MATKEELQKIAILLVSNNTKKAIELNKEVLDIGNEVKREVSELALNIKRTIEETDFGCSKKSVAKLVSLIIQEDIEITDDDDCSSDDDEIKGKKLKIPFYSLMKTKERFEDYDDDTVYKDSFLLKIQYDNCYQTVVNEYDHDYDCLGEDYQIEYRFEGNTLTTGHVRFATEQEVCEYINKMSMPQLISWFGFLDVYVELAF